MPKKTTKKAIIIFVILLFLLATGGVVILYFVPTESENTELSKVGQEKVTQGAATTQGEITTSLTILED